MTIRPESLGEFAPKLVSEKVRGCAATPAMKPLHSKLLEQKGQAPMQGLLLDTGGDIMEAIRRLSIAIAWLTSPQKKHRDIAKQRVRDWVKAGSVSHANP